MLIFAISLGTWTQGARVTRWRCRRCGNGISLLLEIAFREIFAHAFGPTTPLASSAAAILIEAALCPFRLRRPEPGLTGSMIAEGRTVPRAAPYLLIVPGLALVVTVLGVHLSAVFQGQKGCSSEQPRPYPQPRRQVRGTVSALDDVSLQLAKLAVIGESGSGKCWPWQ